MIKITFIRSLTSAILFNFLVWVSYVRDIFFFEIILYVLTSLSFIGLCSPTIYNIKQTIPSRITGYLSTLLALYLSYTNGGEIFTYVMVFWYLLYVSILIHSKTKNES